MNMINKKQLFEFYGYDTLSVLAISCQVNKAIPKLLSELSFITATNNLTSLNTQMNYHGPNFYYAGLKDVSDLMHYLETKSLDCRSILEFEPQVNDLRNMLQESAIELGTLIAELKNAA